MHGRRPMFPRGVASLAACAALLPVALSGCSTTGPEASARTEVSAALANLSPADVGATVTDCALEYASTVDLNPDAFIECWHFAPSRTHLANAKAIAKALETATGGAGKSRVWCKALVGGKPGEVRSCDIYLPLDASEELRLWVVYFPRISLPSDPNVEAVVSLGVGTAARERSLEGYATLEP